MSQVNGSSRPWRDAAVLYARPKIVAMLFLGFASGMPLALTLGTLSVWLTEVGLDLSTIGLFAAVGTPYALKFLWSPLVDRVPLPFMTRLLGRRRGWLIVVQAILMMSIVGLGFSAPATDPAFTALMAVAVAFWSATQDIVIDAFRVELLDIEDQAAGAAMVVFGYRVGLLVSGAGALFLAEIMPWPHVYMIMAGTLLIGTLTALILPEPEKVDAADEISHEKHSQIGAWLYRAAVMPFAEFMTRRGWLAVLLFVILYKFGDALAAVMTNPFMISIGFTKSEIASVAKVFGFTATLAGLAFGGMLMKACGLYRSLLICGVLQLVSNFMFAVQAMAGAQLGLLAVTIGLENLAGGMGTAVFVAYLSSLCNRAFTATQYALLSSLAVVARTWLSSGAGFVADQFDWIVFFIITAVAAIPGLMLLMWMNRRFGT